MTTSETSGRITAHSYRAPSEGSGECAGVRKTSTDNTYPANLCPLFGCAKFAHDCEDLGETVGKSVKTAARSAIRQGTAIHFDGVLSGT
jgi:hypothetical protein